MKFSIIVPVYNAESTLNRCLQSILKQNTINIEILLIENGSTDSSYDICMNYCSKYENVFCYKSLKGVSKARNLGLKYATGDIIGFCDSDDEFVEGALEHIADIFETNKNIICVIGGYYRVTSKNKFYRGDKKSHTCLINKVIDRSLYDFRIMGSVWNKFFKKSLLDGISFNETLSYCEDTHFLISVLSKFQSKIAYVLNIPVYCYIANEQSVTNSTDKLFNAIGQLKYVEALEKISELPNIKKFTRIIIGRQIFWLSIEWYNYAVNEKEKRKLKQNILNNLFCYLLCFYLSPLQIPRSIVITLRDRKKFKQSL